MFPKKTVRDIDVRRKRVLVRVDYNVPLDEKGRVLDKTRIVESLPTINYLMEQECPIVLMSHLGRPGGRPDRKFSLRPVAGALGGLLNRKVQFVDDCIGIKVDQFARAVMPSEVLLLENLRFYEEEEKNDPLFSRALASLGRVFINDAFGSVHRAHASTVGVTQFLPSVAGFLLEREIRVLSELLLKPQRPYFAILGGAKVGDKLAVVRNLLERVDNLMIGGAMAFTFLKAQGYDVGKSLVDDRRVTEVKEILEKYSKKIHLPLDAMAAPSKERARESQQIVFEKEKTIGDFQCLDLGEKTIAAWSEFIRKSKPKTLFWNGPLGMFEAKEFSRGTFEIAKVLGEVARNDGNVIVGGGDSIAALAELGLTREMTHISTGGGASLEYLEGKTLPGIAALQDAGNKPRKKL